MIPLSQYKSKKVAVFGLGKAGNATLAALQAAGAEVYAWDDSYDKTPPVSPVARHYSYWPWSQLEALILSPGVPLTHPQPHPVVECAKQAGVPVIGDIELLWQACPDATYIGITGTNGKSTTTSLIAHILKEAGREVEVGGNLGTPVLELKPLGRNGIYVIETSSYQLDLIDKTRFNVAVLLNLTPDHLDRHGDMEGYLNAKLRIFRNQRGDDTAVIAVDDDYTRNVAQALTLQRVIRVSAHAPADIYVEDGLLIDNACHPGAGRGLCHASAIPPTDGMDPGLRRDDHSFIGVIPTLQGRHNWQNAVCAYAACRAVGVEPEAIFTAMRSFPGLAHRMELVATINGIRFINDSKATNADATANALAAYDDIYWILGGKAKAGGIETLASFFPKIRHAYLIGAAEDAFAQTLEGRVPYTRSRTLDAAIEQAAARAKADGIKGAVVLLSPACASFDQFKSFEHRGEVFKELVVSRLSSIEKEATDDRRQTAGNPCYAGGTHAS